MENKSLHASAIYRIETDGLSLATNIFKVTIFVNMWNLGAILWKFDILSINA